MATVNFGSIPVRLLFSLFGSPFENDTTIMTDTTSLPHPVDEIVAHFVAEITRIEPAFVDGVYLTGSLPLNDFYANKSDVDFLVLCKKLPDKGTATQLKRIHKAIQKRHSKPALSGTYLSSERSTIDKPQNIKTLSYHEGTLRYGNFDMAAVSLSELRFNALTVYGPKAEALPINVPLSYLNQFLHENINSYWKKWTGRHALQPYRSLLLLLFPRVTEWSVLGVARQLCTLQTGKIVSKTAAGHYCLEHLPVSFHPIIREAMEIRKDDRTHPFLKSYAIHPSYRRWKQTVDCVNYVIETFNKTYEEKYQKK